MTLNRIIMVFSLCFPGMVWGALAPMSAGEMAEVSGQALGINFNDIAIASDRGSSADMTYMTLRPSGGNDYVRLSHFYIGKAGVIDPTDGVSPGEGVNAGSVNSPVSLQFPNITSTLVNDGSEADRSAIVLCWTGTDCSDPTNIDQSPIAATDKADMGFRFDIIGNDPALTYRDDTDNGFTDIVWAELNGFGFESESIPAKAQRRIYGAYDNGTYYGTGNVDFEGNVQACDDGDGDGVCQDGVGTTLYDNDIIRTDGKPLEAASVYGGTWLAVWPDELTGLSAAANLRIDADQLRWTYASDNTPGYPVAPDWNPASTVAFNDVSIDLQLGHPFYQPVRLYTASTYDPVNDRTRAEQVLEISSIPLADSAGRQPGEAGYSGVDCGPDSACEKFYDPATNMSDIYIGELVFGNDSSLVDGVQITNGNLGSSYVQGLQIQYLRIQTHDVVN
ncbi:hypothetical protein GP5015_2041 [gamma proteobacterium HTCC5015]|nr:hypothetical protein GP5015_2041 [gamma proteobacterium HTCC5015]